MKITAFNPLIMTSRADEVISTFEALGFERTHRKGGIDGGDIASIRMENSSGFHVDVGDIPNIDMERTVIRMNVDDFDGARATLMAHGFTDVLDHVVDTGTSKFALMVSPSGFAINLCQHIK